MLLFRLLMRNCHLVLIKLLQHQRTLPGFLFHLLLLPAFCRGILQQSPLSFATTKRKLIGYVDLRVTEDAQNWREGCQANATPLGNTKEEGN